ncbi:UDP-2,4-diacetamido-2,4,6-trideoxy-beta-L-altropyranose hydrolase [Halomonas ventosae]|uniref:UDP-2,4-diacetamido-2,4, 6-trideoxy-beta-L-altropyranose hydrolase n=1 Tax=Halomonas ventosae TaxID=229007 RepID=A0A4R6ZWG9_9GAMM|nr:UDP-2,4-diacetamido-2,4,6-trideoxy-beta-L-altropyranose hydrolase [Halomonas ventosae]TDR57253.1 UDP-2,4-diacetamido-2,4,6-trideoxy-beta-L-altropyranose hydrolase [Halomonas ventosae]
MLVVFRADASLEIGTGHIMRCLTLAEALTAQDAACHFLCREHVGHLCDAIEARGFTVHRLPRMSQGGSATDTDDASLDHAHWLGTTWEQDAEACGRLMAQLAPDWLVVDHYALDSRWESTVLPKQTRLLVIDDLADRPHRADLLLDQNLGRAAEDYAGLLPAECRVMAGPRFALLRPEFEALRERSLARRRRQPGLKRLLITLGGVDKDNATGQVLDTLKACDLPDDLGITVVMGATAPWLDDVEASASRLPWTTEVVVNISDMARRMAEADLAIGAAGSTSWERCCLGLPTLMLVLAENQRAIARALDKAGAARCLGVPSELDDLPRHLATLQAPDTLQVMSRAAALLSAGEGVNTLCHAMYQEDALA